MTDGTIIKDCRTAWNSACVKVGLPTKLVHDFRRTAARNLIRTGVSQPTAMNLTGHKSAEVFRRYAIVDEGMLTDAAARLTAFYADAAKSSMAHFDPAKKRQSIIAVDDPEPDGCQKLLDFFGTEGGT